MDNEDRNLIIVGLCCMLFIFAVGALFMIARYEDDKAAATTTTTSVEIEKTSQRNWGVEPETTAEPTGDAYPAEPSGPTEPTVTAPVWEDPDYIPAKSPDDRPIIPEEPIPPRPAPIF